ncbi:hypothetical protein C475_20462 [Halosimplex carlsbadense 2-9-1]|uniref:Uncharacterized protein n=1 Tax=Halosimplex carlsbadense 2-9-1 TaxID=797114 RepID=M0CB33_9EURY|nr:hypothetical protein [Halosimplex carlsbadense]ELZ20455.1 hypothetical protein C475_20462 [Halosimplex carlsbadense 2-9-1]
MVRIPNEFCNEFDEKGETFFEIAEMLYTHPGRQYTQDELAKKVDRSNTTVSNHTSKMVNEGWLDRHEDQTTFVWNTDAHNPASTEGVTAVKRFYADFWNLLKKHSETAPGTMAIIGFALILSALVIFAFFVGFSLGITRESVIPTTSYFVIAAGSFLAGVIVTFLSPLQAAVNRFVWSIIPADLFQNE